MKPNNIQSLNENAFNFCEFEDNIDLLSGIDLEDENDRKPVLGGVFPSAAGGVVHDSRAKQALDMDLRQAFDGIFPDLAQNAGQMDLMANEECLECSFDSSQEFDYASLNNIPNLRGSQRSEIASVTDADFDGPEREIFILLRDKVRATYVDKIETKRRMAAIEWVFCPVAKPITFDLCCRALGMRPHVLRTRVHYQFYLGWILFSAFPFLTVPVPEELQGEIIYLTGDIGLDIARHIWHMPSITTQSILLSVGKKYRDYEVEKVIIDLKAAGIIGNRMANLYLIGRNPKIDGGSEVEVNRKTKRSGFWSSYW